MSAISIHRVIVPRFHQKVVTGQSIALSVLMTKNDVTDSIDDISTLPKVTLYNPLGVKLLNEAEMERTSIGTYTKHYQVIAENPAGLYTATFIAEDEGFFAVLDRVLVFKVISVFTGTALTYFAVKDQEDNIWYWWITETGAIMSHHEPPNFVLTPTEQVPGIPYWFEVENASGDTRYIHPSLTGVPMVSNTEPLVGTGVVGVTPLTALDGLSYTLELTVTDGIIATEV